MKKITRKMFFIRCAGVMAGVFSLGRWSLRASGPAPADHEPRDSVVKPRLQPERRAAPISAAKD